MSKEQNDKRFMLRALKLAARGAGTTHPNPMVGAVIVKDGKIVGEGWHQQPGEPHAEILAIRDAGEDSRGGHLYLNLEPCSHFGRTPPCVHSIAEAGIIRVVAACGDPNPEVDGKGFQILREEGIEVTVGLLEEKAKELNRAFLYFTKSGFPYVTLKLASTLDGRIATRRGESRWITGETSRKSVHRLRAQADAVLVGVGTVLKDDPQLNVRGKVSGNQPKRVVLDPSLKTPLKARLVEKAADGRTLIVVGKDVSENRLKPYINKGVQLIRLPVKQGHFSWTQLSRSLVTQGVIHIMVEGGGKTAAWFIKEKNTQRFEIYLAAILLGEEGVPSMGSLNVRSLAEAPSFKILRSRRLGEDIHITADAVTEDRGQMSEDR
ncbi:bifunctional diaminohydroxyphosphoribosylaminopyrimidine deaminase/5-amino-6-(5-phosphoribosylamino)uracil reductase RibD [bacterium]|nr:MAG: bifunctional diaminohydroxyphosphoribosylaminopyrimidine deaminase/5-amino-6-(5-phosphoribosylamino)uracil reductase RibD [bacterium]